MQEPPIQLLLLTRPGIQSEFVGYPYKGKRSINVPQTRVRDRRPKTILPILAVEWDRYVPGSYTAVVVIGPGSEYHRFETGDPAGDFFAAGEFIGDKPFIEDESLRDFNDHNLAWGLEFYVNCPPLCLPHLSRVLIEGIVEQANGQRPRRDYASGAMRSLVVGPVALDVGDGGYCRILGLASTLRESPKFLIDCRHIAGRPQHQPGSRIKVGTFDHPGGWMVIAVNGRPAQGSDGAHVDMPAATYTVSACYDDSGLLSFYRVEPDGKYREYLQWRP